MEVTPTVFSLVFGDCISGVVMPIANAFLKVLGPAWNT